MRIWDFTEYKPYVVEKLGGLGSRSGLRKQLAEAISVHTTFVSQVLGGRSDFSLEQAEAINDFLKHSDDEAEYFLLLVSKDRSGTKKLKMRFEKKIKITRDQQNTIKNRLEIQTTISSLDKERFYASYVYGAIHVLSGLKQFKTVEALAIALSLSRAKARESVDFMLRIGVLKEVGGKLAPGPNHVHLANDSELILKHHSNWRLHALNNLQFLDREDLHYSACVSLSHDDVLKIKEIILQSLKLEIDIISSSPEETAYVMNFDFYKLIN